MMTSKTKGLGKGLATLLGEAGVSFNQNDSEFRYLRLEHIVPNKEQPRKNIPQDSLEELAISIKANGVIQPIVVQNVSDNRYQIVAGERRWRASQIAGLNEIPAMVKKYDPAQEFEIALIENVQRQNLDPIEEAQGYGRLIDEFKYKQEDIANLLGKSRSHIANTLRLNSLPSFVKQAIIDKQISAGHAKSLVGLEERCAKEILEKIISAGLSVRQTELLVQKSKKQAGRPQRSGKKQVEDFAELEEMLSNKLGVKVTLEEKGGGGQIKILFADMMELDAILTKIA